jgi:hypothetical protein
MKKQIPLKCSVFLTLFLLGCDHKNEETRHIQSSGISLSSGFGDWDSLNDVPFDISTYQFTLQEALSEVQNTSSDGKKVQKYGIQALAIESFRINPEKFISKNGNVFDVDLSKERWFLDGKVWFVDKWIPLKEYAKINEVNDLPLTSPMFLIDNFTSMIQARDFFANMTTYADRIQDSFWDIVDAKKGSISQWFDTILTGKKADTRFLEKYSELKPKSSVIKASFLDRESNNTAQKVIILKNCIDSGELAESLSRKTKQSEVFQFNNDFLLSQDQNTPVKRRDYKDLSNEEKIILKKQFDLLGVLKSISDNPNDPVLSMAQASLPWSALFYSAVNTGSWWDVLTGKLKKVDTAPTRLVLKVEKEAFIKKVTDFFNKNITTSDVKNSLFFKYAFTSSDTLEQKRNKRALLQKEFEKALWSTINLEIENNKVIDGKPQSALIGSIQDLLPRIARSSLFEDVNEKLNAGISSVVPELFDVDRTLTVLLRKADGTMDNFPIDVRRILNFIIPQGRQDDESFLSKAGLPFDASKLQAFLTEKRYPKLALDSVSTRDSRIAKSGCVSSQFLNIDGNSGGKWNLDCPLYFSAKGTFENGKTDALNGVASYRFNHFTLGTTYGFSNSGESQHYQGAFLASKSFDSNVFVEFQGRVQNSEESFVQSYTLGFDSSWCSPFIQLEAASEFSLKKWLGVDFGDLTVQLDSSQIRLSGLSKVSVDEKETVIASELQFSTQSGISLNSSINLNAELSSYVSFGITK